MRPGSAGIRPLREKIQSNLRVADHSDRPCGAEGYLRSRGRHGDTTEAILPRRGSDDYRKFWGEFFLEKNFYEKGMKNFSGRGIFGGETIGGTDPRIRLRHTDGVRRGNVRSAKNDREMNFADDRKRSGIQEPKRDLE